MSAPSARPTRARTGRNQTAVAGTATAEADAAIVDEAPAAQPVDLDLDAIERDGTRPGPFSFRVEGTRFTLMDPRDIDWQDLLVAQRNPLMFIKFTMGEDQYKDFLVRSVPEWKMERMMVAFFKHFGMTDSPEARALLG